jgi:PAS domain S-box-containing protein
VETGSLRLLHQALLGEALMTGSSAVLVSDDEGRYLAVNDGAIALLGCTREDLAGLNARDLTMRSDDEVAEVYAMLRREHAIERTARVRRKDGVIGTIGYIGFESTVGGLPVVVTVTSPIDSFVPEAA